MNKRGRMIGEFVLIVAGVLVALMVEAGLDSRKDDQLRDEYMSRFQADLASFYAAELWPFRPNTSTYQDLHNTGNIRLLGDMDLRTSLAAYYNQADASRPGWNP